MAPFVRVGKYIVKKKIGEGAFAEVRLAAHEETGEEYAVKVFNRSLLPKTEFEREVKKEIRIMQHLRHPNIVSIHAVLVTATKMYLVMELVRGGELYDEIVSHGRIEEGASRRYFQQLVDAMTYCHRRGVVHRDLKPENLLLDGNGNLKVTDFGMSWMKAGQQDPNKVLLSTQCGTPKYMAPEVIMRPPGGYDGRKSDVWEIGMVLYALLAGFLPFTGDDDNAVFRSILNGRVKFPSFFSDGAKEILRLMLDKDPNTRSTLEEVRQHPWFRVNYQGDITKELSTVMSKMVSEVPASDVPRLTPNAKLGLPAGGDKSPTEMNITPDAAGDKENVNVNINSSAPSSPQAQSKPKRRESVIRSKLRAAQVQIPGIKIPSQINSHKAAQSPARSPDLGPAGMLSPVSQWRQDVQMDLGEMERESTPTLAEEQLSSKSPQGTPGSTNKGAMKGFKVKFNFPSPKKKSTPANSDASGPPVTTIASAAAENEGRTRAATHAFSGRLAALRSSHSVNTTNTGSVSVGGSAHGNVDDVLDLADREDDAFFNANGTDNADNSITPPTSKGYFPSLRIPSLKSFSPLRAGASSPRSDDDGSVSVRSFFRGVRLGSTAKADRSADHDNADVASFSSWFSPTSADNSPRTIVSNDNDNNGNNNDNLKKSKTDVPDNTGANNNAAPSSLSWKSFYRTAFSRGE